MDFAAVPYHIITPKDGKNIIDFVQDTMLASYRLTKDHVRIREKSMANLQMVNSYFDGKLPTPVDKDHHLYTGKQAYSAILPPGLMMEGKNRTGQKVIVYNGELKEGTLDKGVYNAMSEGLIPRIFHDYGPFEARRFLDNTQRLMCRWLMMSGFSCGISDLVIEPKTVDKFKTIVQTMKEQAYRRIQEVRSGGLDNHSIFKNNEFFEMELVSKLQAAFDEIGSEGLNQINDLTNRMINMVKSGSKGSEMNVAQMIGALGQQLIDGKRIQYGFTDRTLPHYTKFDDGPEARGFVENSFIKGLEPHEVFFHAMGGREGLIDTAVKTSETGYIQRRMVKAMEDCKVYYDNTVRNATGSVVQFIYGEDGMDGTKLEQQQIPYIQQSLLEMDHQYHLRKGELPEMFFTKDTYTEIQKADWEDRATDHYKKMVEDREFLITKVFKYNLNGSVIYPIPFKRLIRTAALKVSQVQLDAVPNTLTPKYILDTIERLMDKLHVADKEQGTQYLHILLRLHLNPKMVLLTHRLTKAVFDWVVAEIERYFYAAVVQPGETVGIIAAQSIGEPCTQLTLNSFHSSGTAAAVKATSGVPRLRELLSVSKNIKTPTLLIYLQPDIAPYKDKAEAVLQSLEMTKLGDILEMSEIFWDPPGAGFQTGVSEDKGVLDVYHAFSDLEEAQCSTVSPWVLRMKLNKQKMYRMGLRMMDIYTRLMTTNGSIVDCVFSDDNATELILRIRLTQLGLKDIDPEDSIAALKAIEYNFVNGIGNSPLLLKGMQGIRKVSMRQQNQQRYNPLVQAFEKMSEWVLDTDGTNLMEILSNPNVDPVRTVSNDVREIFEVLGIEAARTALYNEIYNVIRDSSLNSRHLYLLVDTITNRGTLMSIDRHGINRADVGPLAKSSFEETTDMLIKAGVFSEFDRINGVSANIMLGQLPPCGTGDSEILLDEEMFTQLIQGATQAPEMAPVEKETTTHAEACDMENLSFTYKLPTLSSTIQFPLPQVTFA